MRIAGGVTSADERTEMVSVVVNATAYYDGYRSALSDVDKMLSVIEAYLELMLPRRRYPMPTSNFRDLSLFYSLCDRIVTVIPASELIVSRAYALMDVIREAVKGANEGFSPTEFMSVSSKDVRVALDSIGINGIYNGTGRTAVDSELRDKVCRSIVLD